MDPTAQQPLDQPLLPSKGNPVPAIVFLALLVIGLGFTLSLSKTKLGLFTKATLDPTTPVRTWGGPALTNFGVEKAFDKNLDTTWAGNTVGEPFNTWVLGAEYPNQFQTGATVTLAYHSQPYIARTVTFEVSDDGTTWFSVSTFTNNLQVVIPFAVNRTFRFVRFTFTMGGNDPNGMSYQGHTYYNGPYVKEITVMGTLAPTSTPGPATPTPPATTVISYPTPWPTLPAKLRPSVSITSGGTYASFPNPAICCNPGFLVDGNRNTFWVGGPYSPWTITLTWSQPTYVPAIILDFYPTGNDGLGYVSKTIRVETRNGAGAFTVRGETNREITRPAFGVATQITEARITLTDDVTPPYIREIITDHVTGAYATSFQIDHPAVDAFDNESRSYWSAASGTTASLFYNYGIPVSFKTVSVTYPTGAPVPTAQLYGSMDGESWTTLGTLPQTNPATSTAINRHFRMIRLDLTSSGLPAVAEIWREPVLALQPGYMQIVHDMAYYFANLNDQDIQVIVHPTIYPTPTPAEPDDQALTRAYREAISKTKTKVGMDYNFIARAFNATVIGHPNRGINDAQALGAFEAAAVNNVKIIVGGGDFGYIGERLGERSSFQHPAYTDKTYLNPIIGFRIWDEYVPPNCEKRRYPDKYPGLGPPCTDQEWIDEGKRDLDAAVDAIRPYSNKPIFIDIIPVEITYSSENTAEWARERPGNSNRAMTTYINTCKLDHLFLSLGVDDSRFGGWTLVEKLQRAETLWSTAHCPDGTTKKIKIGVRYGGGGINEATYAQFLSANNTTGEQYLKDTEMMTLQTIEGGGFSLDLYPWRHKTGERDIKTLDLLATPVPCIPSSANCLFTGRTNPYYESLVNTFRKITSLPPLPTTPPGLPTASPLPPVPTNTPIPTVPAGFPSPSPQPTNPPSSTSICYRDPTSACSAANCLAPRNCNVQSQRIGSQSCWVVQSCN